MLILGSYPGGNCFVVRLGFGSVALRKLYLNSNTRVSTGGKAALETLYQISRATPALEFANRGVPLARAAQV